MKIKDLLSPMTHPLVLSSKPETFLVGTEYEIESVEKWNDVVNESFLIEEDHSLRNNGREFKTKPVTFDESIRLFNLLHDNLELGSEPYTFRTSIHVHVNCCYLEDTQVRQLLLLYAMFEPLFFSFVERSTWKRDTSIFCVPLNYTSIPMWYKADLPLIHAKWMKYTAFNLLPLSHFGTVEFRHLGGTGDVEVYRNWLKIIQQLWTFVYKNPEFSVINELKNKYSSPEILNMVMPNFYGFFVSQEVLNLCKDSVIDVKLSDGGLGVPS